MKKIFLLAGVAMLFSCNQTTQNQNTDNSSGADTEQKTSTQANEYVGTYKGMFPCADCSGINVLITLNESTYTIVNISLPVPEKKADIALLFLDIRGIAVSRGSACQSGSVQSSHVLRAILPEEQWYKAHLRFSFSIFNTKEEIDYSIEVLKEFLQD